jgi:hypothetical protein
MRLLADGWSIFFEYREGISIFFVTLLGLGSLGENYFFKNKESNGYRRAFTIISLGSLLLTWACLVLIGLGRIWFPLFKFGSILLPFACSIYLLWRLYESRAAFIEGSNFLVPLGFGLLFFLYFIVRLAFLKNIILPPYDDSPDHFMIVSNLLQPRDPNQTFVTLLRGMTENYYHIGFHSIAAWLTSVSLADPAQSMGLLGQILICLSSLSIFYLMYVATGSPSAAFVGAVFAAVAWKMPAFAANWGKYPAISGLALLPAWLGLLLASRSVPHRKYTFSLILVLVLPGLGLLHTRLIICLAIMAVALFISLRLKLSAPLTTLQLVIGSGCTILICILFTKPIQIFYSNNFYISLAAMLLLLPFAYLKYPRHMLGISLSMLGVWFASSIPVFFNLYGTSWLDAPFVQTLLFIPFSLIAGLGFSGLLDTLDNNSVIRRLTWVIPVIILISGFTSLNSYYPDQCCNYVSQADLGAIKWIQENSSLDSVIWVAGFKPKNYMIATDAGVWAFALADRNTNKLPYDFDWASPSAEHKICKPGYHEVYVYQGIMDFSFNRSALSEVTWLESVYADHDVIIYRTFCTS